MNEMWFSLKYDTLTAKRCFALWQIWYLHCHARVQKRRLRLFATNFRFY